MPRDTCSACCGSVGYFHVFSKHCDIVFNSYGFLVRCKCLWASKVEKTDAHHAERRAKLPKWASHLLPPIQSSLSLLENIRTLLCVLCKSIYLLSNFVYCHFVVNCKYFLSVKSHLLFDWNEIYYNFPIKILEIFLIIVVLLC